MTDDDSKLTEESGGEDGGKTPPPEKETGAGSDIRDEVDQKLEGIFGELEDDNEDDDAEESAGVLIEIVRGKPAAGSATDNSPDTLSSDVDTQDLPALEDEMPSDVQAGSGQIAPPTDNTVADSGPEETGKSAVDDEVPPPEKEPEIDSNLRDESDDDGDVVDRVADTAAPADTAADTAPDIPDPLVPPTEAVTPARPLADGDKPEEDAVVSLPPETEAPQVVIEAPPPPILFPTPEAFPKPISKVPPPRVDSSGPVRSESNDQPPEMDITAPTPAAEKPRQPLTTRIFVWGAVLIIIAVTVRYFVTYEAEELAKVPTAEKAGQLFHKIAPMPPPVASSPPVDPSAPTPPVVATPKAAPLPKASAPAAKATTRVKAHVPRAYPYAIHMASFQSSALARETVAHYRRGLQAYLVHVDLGKKGIWYRLHFGHFPSATAAMDAIKKYHLTGALVSRTRYACLLGSYPSAAQADAATRRLTGKGFFPYTIIAGAVYHVFVGAHPTLNAAKALSKNLSKNGFSSDLVER